MNKEYGDFMIHKPEVFLYKETDDHIMWYIIKKASKGILTGINMQMTLSKRRLN